MVSPAQMSEMKSAASRIGFTIPPEHEEEYLTLLKGADSAVEAVMREPGMSDFLFNYSR